MWVGFALKGGGGGGGGIGGGGGEGGITFKLSEVVFIIKTTIYLLF